MFPPARGAPAVVRWRRRRPRGVGHATGDRPRRQRRRREPSEAVGSTRAATAPPATPERRGAWGPYRGPQLLEPIGLTRAATAPPATPERRGAWGPYRGPHVNLDISPPQHLLQALARETEPLGRPGLRPALAQRVLDHAPLEMLDRIVERRRCPGGGPVDPDPLGQVRGRDRLAGVGERDGALDLVLELADVAGKRVGAQARHRLRRDRGHRAPGPRPIEDEEVLG